MYPFDVGQRARGHLRGAREKGFAAGGLKGLHESELPVEALYSGYYETVLDKNELITAVTVPAAKKTQVTAPATA